MFTAPTRGLNAEYFVGTSADGNPALSTVDPTPSTAIIARRWLSGAPSTFSARWFGFLTIDRPGRYTFSLSSDDGAVLSVDGQVVVDNSGLHGLQTTSGVTDLDSGSHTVLLQFQQQGGVYALAWRWSGDGNPESDVPEWRLTRQRTSPVAVRAAHLVDQAVRGLLVLAVLVTAALAWTGRAWFARYPRTSALAFFALLTVVHTWPLSSDLAHLTRHDNRDSILNEWIVAWIAHQLPRAPLHLFDANIFFPEPRTLAYSEAMVVQGVLGAPLLWMGLPVVLTYNLLLLAGMTLSGWTAALVVRRWTGDWTAALVAGSIFAFNAHSLSRIPHLQAQHLEFLPLVLFAFDRVLASPGPRRAIELTLWFVLHALTSVYLLVFATFALLASALARLPEIVRRRRSPLVALAGAGALSVITLAPFLLPYWRVSRDLGRVRTLGEAGNYAATWSSYLATPARIHAWWSAAFAADGNVLFPGALGLLLAGLALLSGVAFRDPRARMCLGIGLAGLALSFGTNMPGYEALYRVMPLLAAIRATARFGSLAICAVAILAGFGVGVLRSRVPARRWPAVAVSLVVIAALESTAAPLGLVRFEGIAPVYATLPRDGGVVVEVPFFDQRSAQFHAHYMLNSTAHWHPLVNGYSGFQPPSFVDNATALATFPSDAAFDRLRLLGVRYLFVHGEQLPEGTIATVDARPDVERLSADGATVLYRMRP